MLEMKRAASSVQFTNMPLVTIAMVVRNAATTFVNTFQSIEKQTYPNIQIIVVDGGSDDTTVELIRERSAWITRWVSEPDEGPYDGMNKAARLANGRWILFMNAGDFFYSSDIIENVIKGASEQADFIIGHHIYRSIEGADRLYKASEFDHTWRALVSGRLSLRWQAGVPCHQATFTRTSMLVAEGGYDYRKYPVAADHEFMYRMRSKGAQFHLCDEIISVYLGGGSSSRPDATVKDWWQIARLYGPPKEVDRFFRLNYPTAVGDTCKSPFFAFARRVARRLFARKRPAWVAGARRVVIIADMLFMAFIGRKFRSKAQEENLPNYDAK
jgi:glycosyltransferase involved in cell wall biosynthesis